MSPASTTFASVAARLHANGYRVLPIARGEKKPGFNGWEKFAYYAGCEKSFAGFGAGIICGNVAALDIDADDPELAQALEAKCREVLGLIGANIPRRVGRAPRVLLPLRTVAPFAKTTTGKYRDRFGVEAKVEILCDGQQFVAYHVHPDTREPYKWNGGGDLLTVPLGDLPTISVEQAQAVNAACEPLLAAWGELIAEGTSGRTHIGDRDFPDQHTLKAESPDELRNILTQIPNRTGRDRWVRICHAAKAAGADLNMWLDWCETREDGDPHTDEAARVYRGAGKDDGGKFCVGIGYLANLAGDVEAEKRIAARNAAMTFARYDPDDNVTKLPPREPYSHAALAEQFLQKYGARVRYVPAIGKWYRWNGTHWKRDDRKNMLALFDQIAHVFAIIASADGTLGRQRAAMARTMESASYRFGGESIAKTSPRITIAPTDLDRDPFVLNTPSGVLDLRTGELLAHDPAQLISKIAAAPLPHGTPTRPRFDQFIDEVTCGDRDLALYLQRALGACCFGSNAISGDHWMLFFHGPGRNGKNTLLDLVLWILGDYAKAVPALLLMADEHGNRHPTEIANLVGLRLAASSEINEGSRWAESQIKSLTGDAMLSGRFMRQDLFEFPRTHRHVILGNHRPLLANPDPAMAARLHLVPFNASFIANPDTALPAKLKHEASGVLAWLVEGAREYFEAGGLQKCRAVQSATAAYIESQSTFDMWLDEYCIKEAGVRTDASALYLAFANWKKDRGEGVLSQTRWGEEMGRRFRRVRVSRGSCYVGLRLRGVEVHPWPDEELFR